MKLKFILIIFFFYVFGLGFSQTKRITTSGIIEYEKKINMYAILERSIPNSSVLQSAFNQYKQNHGQFKIVRSQLKFSGHKTLFFPDIIGNPSAGFFDPPPIVGQNSIVFSDFLKGQRISLKKTLDQDFLLEDSINNIKWKITGETRDIKGFHCYRANGIIMDSIYIVAFFTYEIPISGGPESFNGLPGMILGLALPHENISWFAVQINDTSISEKSIIPPQKGKHVNLKEYYAILKSLAKEKNSTFIEYCLGFLL